MAIKLYTGIMGSGKTYEVVSEVILNSIRHGRRVVSNIAGLNYDAMKEILLAEGVPEEKLGILVQVDHEKVLDPLFWPTDKDSIGGLPTKRKFVNLGAVVHFAEAPKEPRKPFIQMGDVVCLDEIWRFWSGFSTKDEDGNKRPPEVMNFFRMHRQMPDPVTGLTCEIAMITQDVPDASRQVRGVLEEIYVMTKLTALGMTSRYRVDIHSRKIGRKPLRSIQRTYNPAYFPLYSSHSQKKEGGATVHEQNIDDRGNIFKGGFFKFGLPVAASMMLLGAFFMWRMFHPKTPDDQSANSAQQPSQSAQQAQPQQVEHKQADVTEEWRVLGHYDTGSGLVVLVQSGNGSVRQLVNPPSYQFIGSGLSVELPEGGFATSWTKVGQKQGGLL